MLDPNLQAQLRAYLEKLQQPIELIASLDASEASRELEELLGEIAALSDKVTSVRRDDDARRPSFAIAPAGGEARVRFAGIPLGHEFTSLVLALLQVGGHPSREAQELLLQTHFTDRAALADDSRLAALEAALTKAGFLDVRVVRDEKEARAMVEQRKAAASAKAGDGSGRATLEDLYSQIQAGQAKELRIILKSDVSGSSRRS